MRDYIHQYVGVVHVHTSFSDGEGDAEEVIAAAREAGLDFLIITDHNDLRAKTYEGWHGDTLVLAGEEVTRPGGNHMLALGIEEFISPELSPQEGIDAAKAQGGLAFLAHPFYQGSPIIDDPPLPWRDWSVKGFDGLEVWNLTADLHQLLGERGLNRPPGEILDYARPNPQALRKWDELLSDRQVVGLGGLDAHAEPVRRWGGEVILPYVKAFRALRLHILTREPFTRDLGHDAALLYRALSEGRFHISFDHLADGREASLAVHTPAGPVLPGEEIGDGDPMLVVEAPFAIEIRVIRDGEEVLRREARSLKTALAPGSLYRVELFRGDRYWVIANPFYAARREHHGR